MGSMREIRARIKSVKNTQQITKAMKMVASAKLRRTQRGLGGIRTFAQQSRHILSELLAGGNGGYDNPFLRPRGEIKKVCYVVFVGNRGLCGVYNSSLLHYAEEQIAADGGESFQTVKTLPTVDSIGFGKGKEEDSYPVIYAEGDDGENGYGIYRSEDKGKSWIRINDEQHKFGNLNPKYITGDSNVYGRVYFCTDGRGIVMGDIAS